MAFFEQPGLPKYLLGRPPARLIGDLRGQSLPPREEKS